MVDLKQFLNSVYKKLWFLISLPILSCIVTVILSAYIIIPVYESSSTLYIINKTTDTGVKNNINYNDFLTNQMFVKDYRELIKSRSVTKEVIEELRIKDLSPGVLAGKITVSMKSETRVLEIKVRDSNPIRAKTLTETVSKIFAKKSISLMNVDNVNIVDYAEVPQEPIRPKPLRYGVYALFLSFFISVCIIFLIEYFNDKIKTSEDVENYMGLTVIGIIPLLKAK